MTSQSNFSLSRADGSRDVSSHTAHMRSRLFTALVTAGLVSACGGQADGDFEGTGGTAAQGGSAQGGSAQGGSAQGGSAQGGSAQGGSVSVGGSSQGGSGSVGGSSFGGSAQGGSSFGGSAQGGSSFGGGAGVGGQGGFGGVAGEGGSGGGFFTEGNVDCTNCSSTWTTCWAPEDVPTYPGTQVSPEGCPYGVDEQNNGLCDVESWQYLWFDLIEPTPFGGYCCYSTMTQCLGGRPFLVGEEARVASVVRRTDWLCETESVSSAADTELSPEARSMISASWLMDASMEHASVGAFARLSLQLMSLGAPPALVRDAQLASIDEIAHAESCFALAARFSGENVGPGPIGLQGAFPDVGLRELALSAFEEGCIGETVAALVALRQLDGAEDVNARLVLAKISEDESKHAELSWRVVGWALSELSPSARAELVDEIRAALVRHGHATDAALSAAPRLDAALSHALKRFGRISEREALQVRRDALAQVVAPCLAALASNHAPWAEGSIGAASPSVSA